MAVFLLEILLQCGNLDGPKWKSMPALRPSRPLRTGYKSLQMFGNPERVSYWIQTASVVVCVVGEVYLITAE